MDESIVLVRLPFIAGRDIVIVGLCISDGGVTLRRSGGACGGAWSDRDEGVLGNGFSREEALALGACLLGCVDGCEADGGGVGPAVEGTGVSSLSPT